MKYLVMIGDVVNGMEAFGPFENKEEADIYTEFHGLDKMAGVVPIQETFDFPALSGAYRKKEFSEGDKMVMKDIRIAEANYELGITVMRGDEKSLCLNRSLYGPYKEKGSYAEYARKFWATMKILQKPVIRKYDFTEVYGGGISGRVTVSCAYSGE